MTNMIEKARSNRTRALRMHALRTAAITNVFTPVQMLDAEPMARQGINQDTQRRTLRLAPTFVSRRHMDTPKAA